MVQADGDQQAVEEGVDAGASGAHADDGFTEVHQATVDDRPDGHQHEGDSHHDHGGDDGHQTAAREEGQRLVQLDAAEAVVELGGDDATENADELVADLAKGSRNLIGRDALELGHGARAQQGGDHQEADQTRQGGGTVFILGHAIGDADGEQDGHAVDDGGTGLDQERRQRAAATPTVRVNPVTNPHQDRCGRQDRYRHHQGTADLL